MSPAAGKEVATSPKAQPPDPMPEKAREVASGPSQEEDIWTGSLEAMARIYTLGVFTGLLIAGLLTLWLRRPTPPPIALQPPPPPPPTPTPSPTPTPMPLVVFVSGAVARPGLYTLPPGARVGDALAAAGGLTEDAAAALVNQAEPLFDGAQVHVPRQGTENQAGAVPPPGVSGSAAPGAPATDAGDKPVDLNTATPEELMGLPGIGPTKAAAIIAHRPYASVEELLRVPGIGERTLEQLRPLVTVGP